LALRTRRRCGVDGASSGGADSVSCGSAFRLRVVDGFGGAGCGGFATSVTALNRADLRVAIFLT